MRLFQHARKLAGISTSHDRVRQSHHTSAHAEGQVLIMFALALVALIGILALAVDVGYLMAERRQTYSAADAGAMAAAVDYLAGESSSRITASGQAYGSSNAGVPAANVSVHQPPISGDFAGESDYVQVIVEKDVEKYFVGALYAGDWRVAASSVAGVGMEQKPYALLALGCDAKNPGIYINGTTDIHINDGSVMANCDIESSGGSNVFTAGGTIDAHGTVEGNENWSAEEGIRDSVGTVTDPLAGTEPPPSQPQVTEEMLEDAGFSKSGPKWICDATCTLSPGHYDNLDTIQAGGTINFGPGIYVFDGNTELSLSNTSSWIKGDGVLLYFAEDSNASFDAGNGNIELSAPCLETTPSIPSCSGLAAYPNGADGMTLWIDNGTEFISGGNGVFRVEGAIYAPDSHVQLHGTPDSNGMQVIVHTLKLVGTSLFELNYRQFVEADTPAIFLVE